MVAVLSPAGGFFLCDGAHLRRRLLPHLPDGRGALRSAVPRLRPCLRRGKSGMLASAAPSRRRLAGRPPCGRPRPPPRGFACCAASPLGRWLALRLSGRRLARRSGAPPASPRLASPPPAGGGGSVPRGVALAEASPSGRLRAAFLALAALRGRPCTPCGGRAASLARRSSRRPASGGCASLALAPPSPPPVRPVGRSVGFWRRLLKRGHPPYPPLKGGENGTRPRSLSLRTSPQAGVAIRNTLYAAQRRGDPHSPRPVSFAEDDAHIASRLPQKRAKQPHHKYSRNPIKSPILYI